MDGTKEEEGGEETATEDIVADQEQGVQETLTLMLLGGVELQ